VVDGTADDARVCGSAGRITTVTLNPAVDIAVTVERLILGGTNRCRLDSVDPGGKGLNASRVIRRLGRETLALGFVGGATGQMIRSRLDAEGVPHIFDEVDELTRLNTMVYELATGQRTRIYLPGARVDRAALARLRERLAAVQPGAFVILAGSVPPGLSHDVYRDLVGWLGARGIRTVVDTSGAALAAVLDARPTLIKPNANEVMDLLGRTLANDADVVAAASELSQRGAENVVISQGAAGAIAVGPEGVWKAVPPSVVARSTVGSGDSMVAGLTIALTEGTDIVEALRLGTAAGAATAIIPGTQLCHPDDVARFLPEVIVLPLAGDGAVRPTRGGRPATPSADPVGLGGEPAGIHRQE
jgi:1-phosphofructokinase family hexose kinase